MADTEKPKFDKQAWQEENEIRTKELTDKLEAGVKDLFSSDKYKEYLKSMSHFHNYSSRNIMLIHSQMPKATKVASFKLWKEKFNRSPKRGETALRIFAPIEIKPKTELFEKIDPTTGKVMLDDNGKPILEELTELTKRSVAFKLVPVFDVSQTAGEPLPQLAEDLIGNVEHYEAFIDTLKEVSPLPIVFEPMNENQDGYCQYGVKIGIREGMSEIQTVCAIIHEITHARLHDRDKTIETDKPAPKEVKEIEAESVSYVVCQKYGIETGANSFGYLAIWGTHDLNEFKASQDTIRKESNTLINAIDDRFKVICKERGIDLTATEQIAETTPQTQAVEPPTEPQFATEATTQTIAGVEFTVNEVVQLVTNMTITNEPNRQAGINQPPPGEENKALSREQRIYEQLSELFPNITSGEYLYQRMEAGAAMMPLSLEWISNNRLSVMHTYAQNGDLMYDPMIVYEVNQEAKTATSVEFQQSNPPIYQIVDEDGVGHSIDGNGNERRIHNLQAELNDFTAMFLSNIKQQNYVPVTAVLRDEVYKDPAVYFNADQKPFNLGFIYESEGTTILNNLDKDNSGNVDTVGGIAKVAHVDSFRNVTYFEDRLPADVVQIINEVELINEQNKQANVDRQSPAFYHIGSGPTENGVEVWNWNETEDKNGQPKFLATINFDREITFLDDSLPDDVKIDIKRLSTANWKEIYAIEMAGKDYNPPPPPWEKEFMPDSSISIGDRDEYGYVEDDMLPLKLMRALELFKQDHTIYRLYEDGTESMAYEFDDIKFHQGIYGIEREDWQKSLEYRENANKTNQQQEVAIESAFINAKEDTFAIYQIMDDSEKARNYRFEGLSYLEQRGLEVNRNHYVIVHTEPLTPDTTLEGIFQKFNEPPKDFSGHSLSVSDVIVLNKGGDITSHFVDRFGFSELPAFLGIEKQPEQAAPAVHKGGSEPTTPPIAPPAESPTVQIPDIPRKDQPIYTLSIDEALRKGEIDAYHDSRKINVECGSAIDRAVIASNYEEYRYDLNSAVRDVIDKYGADRVAWVLASNVNYYNYDGRLTTASKNWAKTFDTPTPDVYLQSHMIIIEGLVDKFRKVEKEKPSLMSALDKGEKKSKTEFDGKAQPGLDALDKTKKKTGMEV
ncbi:MAG: YodL domain-containing protein [Defluviitaleaceae bacterium]|nr:YodL domain-containing protein [Defluviitaleaceae bacterium]